MGISGLAITAVLALVPLLAAISVRPEDQSVLGAYLVALGALAAISVGAVVFLGWEVARHRHRQRPPTGDHGDPSD